MSTAVFVRAKPMTDAAGRADYISNPERQENLLAVAGIQDKSFWRQLGKESQEAWLRSGGDKTRRACEAREVFVLLPREILDLPAAAQQQVAEQLAEFYQKHYGLDCLVGLHLSKTDGNVHAHILFSERSRLPEPEVRIADRNAFIDESGVRRRTKKEILDDNGELRPGCRIIRKGEVLYERHFGNKDPVYAEKGWLQDVKTDMANWINGVLEPDVRREVFDRSSPYLSQIHLGALDKAEHPDLRMKADRIRQYNSAVKIFNARVRSGVIPNAEAHRIKTAVLLAPDRLPALRGAMLMQDGRAGYIPTTMAEQGGRRTKVGPNAAKKQELRDLYRLAAVERQAAKTSVSLADRVYHTDAARQYSARINRLRMELGYFSDEDYVRRLKRIADDVRRRREWMLRCKSRSSYYSHQIDSIKWRIKKLEKELFDMPIFFLDKEEKAKKARLRKEIDDLKMARSEAWEDYFEARRQEKDARKAYKEEKAAVRARKKALKEARIEQIKAGKSAEPRDR